MADNDDDSDSAESSGDQSSASDDETMNDDDAATEKFGFPLGNPQRDIVANGKGRGREPSDAGVDSKKTANDFRINDAIFIWWWGRIWPGKLVSKQADGLCTVRFADTAAVVSGYRARLLFK